MFWGLFTLGAPRDPPYNIAFRCGRPSQSQTRVLFRARRLPGQMSASERDAPEEPLPLHLLMQIAHFRASRFSAQISASGRASRAGLSPLHFLLQIAHFQARRLSGQISASGQPSPEESLPLPILTQIAQSGPGASLLRFCHLAGLPHRSLFP